MALDFPNSPVAGTVFGAWRYDGVKWGAVSGVSGGGSAGDITAVLAGAGLSGGGTEGDVSLALSVPVTLARGGTGATDATTALTNLGGAPLASPTFTGDPQAPTPATADNDTSVATTAYVKAQGYQTANQTITLSGDASGSGTTAITATLAAVNANVGTFQGLTVNAKGLVTAAANQSYLTGNQTITLSGYATGSGTTAITATVGKVKGVIDASSATAGDVGEYVQGQVLAASGITITSNVSFNLTSISLTAGDWDVSGHIRFIPTGGSVSLSIAAINTTSAAFPDGSLWGYMGVTPATGTVMSVDTPITRINVSATTTVYLVGQTTLTAGSAKADGILRARRVR